MARSVARKARHGFAALLLTAAVAAMTHGPVASQASVAIPTTQRESPSAPTRVATPGATAPIRTWTFPYPELLEASGRNALVETAAPTPTATPMLFPPSDGVTRTLRVPILMYHYVSTPPDRNDALRKDLSVPPQYFAEQLAYLRDQGYTSISLDDLALALTAGHPLPPRPIILTFDDGHRDHYECAYPILKAFGFTGTFFVLTYFIDQKRPEYLSWDHVKEMNAAGMHIESHAYTHVDLRKRDADYLVWQMLGSKEAIEERTGRPVRFFCYPAGHYDDLAIRVLDSAHYWGAATIVQGVEQRSDRLFELQRIRVRGRYRLSQFAALLETASAPEADDAPGYSLRPDEKASTAAPDTYPSLSR